MGTLVCCVSWGVPEEERRGWVAFRGKTSTETSLPVAQSGLGREDNFNMFQHGAK